MARDTLLAANWPDPLGFAWITISAGAPIYRVDGSVPQVCGCFDPAVAPVDNGAGDFTLAMLSALENIHTFFEFLFPGAAAAAGLKTAGWIQVTGTTFRFTTLQEGAAGAVSALTDMDVIIKASRFPQLPRI